MAKKDSYYDSTAANYNELHGQEQKAKARLILENIKPRKSWLMLDIGAGTGISTALFPCRKMCIDPSLELLKQNPFPSIQASAESIPFKDHSFDLVVSITAVHNFKDIEKGLKEIKRVGKRLFVITVLKKSGKKDLIGSLIRKHFKVVKVFEEEHDIIYILN